MMKRHMWKHWNKRAHDPEHKWSVLQLKHEASMREKWALRSEMRKQEPELFKELEFIL